MSINGLIKEIKASNQDFEFYPTTNEIIDLIRTDLKEPYEEGIFKSVLDCGAGNGQTLDKLTDGDKYAIEKSEILISAMPANIFIVGTEFFENSLIDKKVDVVFCNPPYSQYREWAVKIINEANCNCIYLVLPERWKNQPEIKTCIEDRKASFKVLGNFDFLEADRKARAKADVIKISLNTISRYSNSVSPDIDPFSLWVEKTFPINSQKTNLKEQEQKFREKINELVPGRGLANTLVSLYQNELNVLQTNFANISGLDFTIFSELKIDFASIVHLLKSRIVNLKTKYWRELFDHFEPVTNRLTSASRKALLDTLTKNIGVDFNENNIYAVTLWAIKNANHYFDQQLIDVYVGLSKKANCIKYKSNLNTWENDHWRFNEIYRDGKAGSYCLDYRCVLEFYNTFDTSSYGQYDYPKGLKNSVHDAINDIIAIAKNLGFACNSSENSLNKDWKPGQSNDFYMNDGKILMNVRAYKNGNIHFKFDQKFLKSLNIEFGRLKGWLRNAKQASQEMDITETEAKKYFKTNFSLEYSAVKSITN